MEHIDQKKADEFLKKHRDAQNIIRYVWTKARYISLSEMFQKLDIAMERFLARKRELGVTFLLYKFAKWGSENWLASIYYAQLGRPRAYTWEHNMPNNEYHVVVIDDAAYSGNSLFFNSSDIQGFMTPKKTIHIYFILAFATRRAIRRLLSLQTHNTRVYLFIGEVITTITEYVTIDSFPMNWRLFNKINTCSSERDVGEDVATIWFEHKLACDVSTIHNFLNGLLLIPPDRSCVEASSDFEFDML